MVTASGIGVAFPPAIAQTDLWSGFFEQHFQASALGLRLFESVQVQTRHAVANPIFDDVSSWSTGDRMARYLPEALPLARQAADDALAAASIEASDIGLLVVASCTGYATPGVDTYLARDLGLSASTQRTLIGHMGCYAALPGLRTASDFAEANQRAALLVCVELASLHTQPPTLDVEQMLVHALFSDGASAVVIEPSAAEGFDVVDVVAVTDAESAGLMTWNVTDLGFQMGLSQRVPEVLEQHIGPLIDRLLASQYLAVDDIAGWAVHPGGPRVLDVVESALKLGSDLLRESRSVLRHHGNFSSATLLAVLEEVRAGRELKTGDHVVAVAFGPGLTLYAALLKYCRR